MRRWTAARHLPLVLILVGMGSGLLRSLVSAAVTWYWVTDAHLGILSILAFLVLLPFTPFLLAVQGALIPLVLGYLIPGACLWLGKSIGPHEPPSATVPPVGISSTLPDSTQGRRGEAVPPRISPSQEQQPPPA